MNKQKRFAEYKQLRKTMTQGQACKSMRMSQPLGSHYDKFSTYTQYQKYNKAKDSFYKSIKTERYINEKDTQEAYDRWCRNQSKRNLEVVETFRAKTSAKKPKKVSWKFAPKVPTWMKRLGGK